MKQVFSQHILRYWLAIALVVSGVSFLAGEWLSTSSAQQRQDNRDPWWAPREKLGIYFVERKLKLRTPVGSDIIAGHVEGAPGNYMPNTQAPMFRNVGLQPMSGESKANDHATATARVIYGKSGLAPGIAQVRCYTTNHWLSNGYLNTGTSLPPVHDDTRIFNHSWISNMKGGEHILRRIDYAVDKNDVIMVVGVNNGKETKVPSLLSSAFNVIAVGVNNGNSSGGYTQFEGEGRCKPDISGPANLTSFSTAMVSAVTARLLQAADRMIEQERKKQAEEQANDGDDDVDIAADGTGRQAPARSETIKAVLLAGAVKPANWSHSAEQPLDEHLGAGAVRFDKSLIVLLSGQPGGDEPLAPYGWDFNQLQTPFSTHYDLTIEEDMGELSLVLVWNRRIDGRTAVHTETQQRVWIDSPRLANFDLKLSRIEEDNTQTTLAESRSTVDNVEHVYRKELPAGRYRIEVSRNDSLTESWDYAIAWRLEKKTQPAAEAEK